MAELPTAGDHPNRLLAAMDPECLASLQRYLEAVELPRGTVLYESGDIIRHAYFPHNCVVSLITVMVDGGSVEIGIFGRESVCGLVGSTIARESLGRYLVQIPGSASRIPVERLQ